MAEITKIKPTPRDRIADNWPGFRRSIEDRFRTVIQNRGNDKNRVLYVAGRHEHERKKLWDIFFDNLPEEGKSHYNCNSCRHFVQTYGTLVVMDENGNKSSILWDPKSVSEFFFSAVSSMKAYVESLPIAHVFVPTDAHLGFGNLSGKDNEEWTHFNLDMSWFMKYRSECRYHQILGSYWTVSTANQYINEINQDVRCILNDLETYSVHVANKGLSILESGDVYRANQLVPMCKWFIQMHEKTAGMSVNKKSDMMFYEMATSKHQNNHIGSSLLGTMFDDIEDGKSFAVIKARLEEKLDPENYMRSKSGPTAYQIEEAEKLVAELGVAESFQRRYAKASDIPEHAWEWRDKSPTIVQDVIDEKKSKPEKTGGVFSSVIPVDKKPQEKAAIPDQVIPPRTMAYDTFVRKILPDVKKLYIKTNDTRFVGLTAPVDHNTASIFKWDNDIAWYYHGGVDMKRRVEDAGGKYENVWMRASLAWEGPTDLDIHCVVHSVYINPRRDHIYFNEKHGRARLGMLDVDANGGRVTSYEPVENIYFKKAVPDGTYVFYVQNYQQRTEAGTATPFTIELYVNGKTYTTKYEAQDIPYERWTKSMFTVTVKKNGSVIEVYDHDDNLINGHAANDSYVPVSGIMKSPNAWSDMATDEHRIFIVDGLTDPLPENNAGFFVEYLDGRFHSIRKTIEQFIKVNPVRENDNGEQVCGYGYMMSSQNWNLELKCEMTDGTTKMLIIDRAE